MRRARRPGPRRPLAVVTAGLAALATVAACSQGAAPTVSPSAATATAGGPSASAGTLPQATGSGSPSTSPPSSAASSPAAPSGRPALPTQPARQAPAADLQRFYSQQAAWRSCGHGVQCARITVPLDYARPAGATITLALNRLPATGTGPTLGALVVNPGGPGSSGLDYALAASQIVDPGIRARYDVVGFDPRGVGESTPVSCLDTAALDAFVNAAPAPSTPAQVAQVETEAKAMADGCAKNSARILPYLGTEETAQDLDVIRAVLGQARLTYLGKSYGTFIGSAYAQRFPARVGRFVLDGAVDPTLSAEQLDLGQAGGFQLALTSFLQDWISSGVSPLGATPAAAQATLLSRLAALSGHPMGTGSARALTQAEAYDGLLQDLYLKQSWPELRMSLAEFAAGSGAGLLYDSDTSTGRGPSGYVNNAIEAYWATYCLDRSFRETDAEIAGQVPAFEKVSPAFGVALAWGALPCRDWHVPTTGAPAPTRAAGAPPILVVGTTRDPATPYAWARALASQLDSGVFLSRVGDGHTAYKFGNPCIDAIVDTYLLSGRPPADGTVCADPSAAPRASTAAGTAA